jgi:hypothetical protein
MPIGLLLLLCFLVGLQQLQLLLLLKLLLRLVRPADRRRAGAPDLLNRSKNGL